MGQDAVGRLPNFNPRSPDGERPASSCCLATTRNFNPRSPDGERPQNHAQARTQRKISIHAPRMGSDGCGGFPCFAAWYFNPRSPDGERRGSRNTNDGYADFNPRSPDGERRIRRFVNYVHDNFNPRSPDGERPPCVTRCIVVPIFQSTLPGWGATSPTGVLVVGLDISIHAPRMGSDKAIRAKDMKKAVFQSTLPGWGATLTTQAGYQGRLFQSTLPGWGATTPR